MSRRLIPKSDIPCYECDSKDSENDNTINKVTSLDIIVRMIDNKPYYEIEYKKVGENYYHVGYSSYNLDNVLKWYSECFELVNEKNTNADQIRSLSDEKLAEFLSGVKEDYQWIDQYYPDCEDDGAWLEWLQSTYDY